MAKILRSYKELGQAIRKEKSLRYLQSLSKRQRIEYARSRGWTYKPKVYFGTGKTTRSEKNRVLNRSVSGGASGLTREVLDSAGIESTDIKQATKFSKTQQELQGPSPAQIQESRERSAADYADARRYVKNFEEQSQQQSFLREENYSSVNDVDFIKQEIEAGNLRPEIKKAGRQPVYYDSSMEYIERPETFEDRPQELRGGSTALLNIISQKDAEGAEKLKPFVNKLKDSPTFRIREKNVVGNFLIDSVESVAERPVSTALVFGASAGAGSLFKVSQPLINKLPSGFSWTFKAGGSLLTGVYYGSVGARVIKSEDRSKTLARIISTEYLPMRAGFAVAGLGTGTTRKKYQRSLDKLSREISDIGTGKKAIKISYNTGKVNPKKNFLTGQTRVSRSNNYNPISRVKESSSTFRPRKLSGFGQTDKVLISDTIRNGRLLRTYTLKSDLNAQIIIDAKGSSYSLQAVYKGKPLGSQSGTFSNIKYESEINSFSTTDKPLIYNRGVLQSYSTTTKFKSPSGFAEFNTRFKIEGISISQTRVSSSVTKKLRLKSNAIQWEFREVKPSKYFGVLKEIKVSPVVKQVSITRSSPNIKLSDSKPKITKDITIKKTQAGRVFEAFTQRAPRGKSSSVTTTQQAFTIESIPPAPYKMGKSGSIYLSPQTRSISSQAELSFSRVSSPSGSFASQEAELARSSLFIKPPSPNIRRVGDFSLITLPENEIVFNPSTKTPNKAVLSREVITSTETTFSNNSRENAPLLPSMAYESDITFKRKQVTQQRQVPAVEPVINIVPNKKPVVVPEFIPFTPPPRRVEKNPPPPPLFFKPNFPNDKPKKYGFDVLVRRRGEFSKVSNTPLARSDALALGRFKVGSSSAATFKLAPAGASVLGTYTGPRGNEADFYTRGDLFIEKRSRRIKSSGEKREITFKGILSNRGGNKKNGIKIF